MLNILKKSSVILVIICLILVAAGCGESQQTNSDETIDMSESIEIALTSSGHTRDQISNLHVEYEANDDDNKESFDITFEADGSKYEYLINASDGTVLEFDVRQLNSSKDPANDDDIDDSIDENIDENLDYHDDNSENASSDSTYIGVDKAKEIALNHAKVSEKDATFQKAKLSYDDGIHEYELEFYSNTMEYDYEIQAHTGEILDWDHDKFSEDWDD